MIACKGLCYRHSPVVPHMGWKGGCGAPGKGPARDVGGECHREDLWAC
ncbi:MAG: hypothetical protein ABR985_00610 [Methanotrichaceae archaeon]|jgi:hypothetical protein